MRKKKHDLLVKNVFYAMCCFDCHIVTVQEALLPKNCFLIGKFLLCCTVIRYRLKPMHAQLTTGLNKTK